MTRPARRTDLDLLRIVLCISVIVQHAVLIFAAEPRYHLKSAVALPWATALYEALRIFAMPPFFAVAGWAAVNSLRRRGPARFARERLSRLLVPLVAGIVVSGPIIKFIELRHGRDLSLAGFRLVEPLRGDFLAFLPRYYTRIALVTWSHLWFLAYLLLFSFLLLPLLVHLARRRPVAGIPPAASVYLPALPLALVLALFHGYWPYLPNLLTDWANVAYFALCFAAGAGIAAWPGFEDRMTAEAPRLALLAALAFAGVLLCGESTWGRALVGLTAWGCVGAAWGLARRYAPARSSRLAALSEATMPVYVVHHAPLLLIGVAVLALPWPPWFQIALIAATDLAVSVAILRWVIRPWPALRWLTGLAPPARQPID